MCMVQKRELKYRMIDILILFLINLMTLPPEGAPSIPYFSSKYRQFLHVKESYIPRP